MSARKKESKSYFGPAARLPLPVTLGGGAAGVLLVVWLLSRSGSEPRALEDQVATLRARPAGDRYGEWEETLRELNAAGNHPSFSKLPKADQEFIHATQRALRAYEQYQGGLAAIHDPRTATDLEQLDKIGASLTALKIPSEYRVEWADTDAYKRHAAWMEDAQTLGWAVNRVQKSYEAVAVDGERVIKTANEANLPNRTKSVINVATSLPDPAKDKDRSIPESQRITYGVVFGFKPVMEAYQKWKGIEARLKPLLDLPPS
jgi:hypothetical protein